MSLELFTDLMVSSTAADLNGPEQISNQVTRKGYILKYLLAGSQGFDTIQGGTSIRTDLILDEVSTAVNWVPGQKFTHSNPQVLSNTSAPWRFTSDFRTWNGPEILLNTAEMSTHARNLKFVSMQKKIDIRCATSIGHFMEDQCHALPVHADMEADSGLVPNSLHVFNNELPDGLYGSYRAADSKVQGIDKSAKPAWDNERTSYDRAGAVAGTGTHIFDAFETLFLKMGYQQLPGPDGAANSNDLKTSRVCFTQMVGVQQYQAALRLNQDYFRASGSGLDPNYIGAVFDGMPIVYIEKMDTAPVYPTSSDASQSALALGAETLYGTYDENCSNAAIANQGARYHVYDFECLQKIVHAQRYFHRGAVKEPVNQLEAFIQPVTTYHNNTCSELRKQGTIYPTTDI